jgi:hypothetical protein
VFVQFVLVLGGTSALLFLQERVTPPQLATGAVFAVVSLVAIGALLERAPWAVAFEWARVASLPLVGWVATGSVAAAGMAAVGAVAFALWGGVVSGPGVRPGPEDASHS